MPTVAEQLRRAREARGFTVYQVAEVTKIKTDHVRALEEGNYDAFSASVYIRGFVRTYATVLRLDLPQIMSTLEAELVQTERFREPPSLPHIPAGWLDFWTLQLSKIQWRIILPVFLLGLVVVLSIWGVRAWRSHSPKDPLSNLGPGLYHPPTQGASQTLPLPTNAHPHPQ
jgi:cytoskeletal protein RodZ